MRLGSYMRAQGQDRKPDYKPDRNAPSQLDGSKRMRAWLHAGWLKEKLRDFFDRIMLQRIGCARASIDGIVFARPGTALE